MNEPSAAARPAGAQDLLERLSASQDFPAFSQVIAQVNRITAAEDSHAEQLTDAILKDVGLTHKLLRLVNSAQFGFFGQEPIGTISRAVIILGFDAVRDAALSLMLFEHLQNHAQAEELKGEAIDSFYCGILGRLLARRLGHRDSEAVFICALFRNLGRLVARLHLHEATEQVTALSRTEGLSEEAAARRVLGMSYDEIGQVVGRHWKLPTDILEGMRPLPPGPVKPSIGHHQVLANLARDPYTAVRDTPADALGRAVGEIAHRYEKAVNLAAPFMVEAIHQAGEAAQKELALLQRDARMSPFMRTLLDRAPAKAPARPVEAVAWEAVPNSAPQGDAQSILISGLQEMTTLLLENAHPAVVLQAGAELLYRTGGFDNVIVCTLDPGNQYLCARIGHGPDWSRLRAGFRIPLALAADVFQPALARGLDILISDTCAENIRDRIPAWYRRLGVAKSFLLLPIRAGNRCIALVYLDRREAPLQLSEQTLGLVKALRNQLTMALRSRS
ncbi:MAG: HDOD domain-containing protein [Thiobacillaceae bacterium]